MRRFLALPKRPCRKTIVSFSGLFSCDETTLPSVMISYASVGGEVDEIDRR